MAYKRVTGNPKKTSPAKTFGTMENIHFRQSNEGPMKATSKPGKSGTMGVSSKSSAGKVSQGGDPGGAAAGRARTNKGKNNTGAGPQGMRG